MKEEDRTLIERECPELLSWLKYFDFMAETKPKCDTKIVTRKQCESIAAAFVRVCRQRNAWQCAAAEADHASVREFLKKYKPIYDHKLHEVLEWLSQDEFKGEKNDEDNQSN